MDFPLEKLFIQLERADFRLSLGTRLTAYQLLQQFGKEYQDDPYSFGLLLAPLLCINEAEQAVFMGIYQKCYQLEKIEKKEKVIEAPITKDKDKPTKRLQESQKEEKTSTKNKEPKKPKLEDIPQQKTVETPSETSQLAWKEYFAAHDQPPYKIPFQTDLSKVQIKKEFYDVSKALKERELGDRHTIDIAGTVINTIHNAGFTKIAWKQDTKVSEYLFLLPEESESHQTAWFQFWTTRLKQEGVRIQQLTYKQGFQKFYGKAFPSGIAIDSIWQLFSGFRLVIFGDGKDLLTYGQTGLQPSVQQMLKQSRQKVLISLKPTKNWRFQEQILQRYLPLLPDTLEGFLALEEVLINGELPNKKKLVDNEGDFPIWLEKPELLDWVASLSVSEQVHWAITIAVGEALEQKFPDEFKNLLSLENLQAMAKHPSLQNELWDEDEREELLETLDNKLAKVASNTIDELLTQLDSATPENSYAKRTLRIEKVRQQIRIDPNKTKQKEQVEFLQNIGLLVDWQLKEKVFLSYSLSQRDSRIITIIKKELRKREIEIVEKDPEINEAEFPKYLKNRNYSIAIITNDYLKSEYCISELFHILSNDLSKKYFYPLVFPDVNIPSLKKAQNDNRQKLNLRYDQEEFNLVNDEEFSNNNHLDNPEYIAKRKKIILSYSGRERFILQSVFCLEILEHRLTNEIYLKEYFDREKRAVFDEFEKIKVKARLNLGGNVRRNEGAGAGVDRLNDNRTIYAGQFSYMPIGATVINGDIDDPTSPKDENGNPIRIRSVNEALEFFNPEVEVEFEDDEGTVKENFVFKKMTDFGRKGFTEKSDFLSQLQINDWDYKRFSKQLKSNKTLLMLLKDSEAREAYIGAIKALINELKDNNNYDRQKENQSKEKKIKERQISEALSLKENLEKLKKFQGFEILMMTIDEVDFLNPKKVASRQMWLNEAPQKNKKTLKRRLEKWVELLQSSEDLNQLIDKAESESAKAAELTSKNIKKALEASREFEETYRGLALFFENAGSGQADGVTFVDADKEALKNLDDPTAFDAIRKELKDKFKHIDLSGMYSMLVIPGWLGKDAVHKWAKIAWENRVQFVSDFVGVEDVGSVLDSHKLYNPTGNDASLANAILIANYLVAREKDREAGEETDVMVPPSAALSGKIFSIPISQPASGKRFGRLDGVKGTAFRVNQDELTDMDEKGIVPMVQAYGQVQPWSAKTLFTGDNVGLKTYSVVRVFDYISKVMVHFLNQRFGEQISGGLLKDIQRQLSKFLDSIKGHGKVIRDFKIIKVEEGPNQPDHIDIQIHITPFYPARTFEVEISAVKGETIDEWIIERNELNEV